MSQTEGRAGAVSAIVGSLTLIAGTWLHPVADDPNDALASFTLYAADHHWVASHLMQLAGVALLIASLLVLAGHLESAAPSVWASFARAGAVASLALAAVLQAVDGVALKRAVDSWAVASGVAKMESFQAAFAVRQIEIGLASILGLALGLTAVIFGIAILGANSFPKWTGVIAIFGGAATTASAVIMASTGFSALAMTVNMPASLLLVLWTLIVGVTLWRQSAGDCQG